MALTATVFKAEVQVADMDRPWYGERALTIARHPSETDERMMVRVLAFALHASDTLQFTRGLCADDEPDIWSQEPSGQIDIWIEVGQPDARRIRKACNRAEQVVIYAYGGHAAQLWWQRTAPEVARFDNLRVIHLPAELTRSLPALVARNMRLQCTVQENQVWLSDAQATVTCELDYWQGGATTGQ